MFAYVLINVVPAKEHEAFLKLSHEKRIVDLNPLFGEYDLIAKIEAKTNDELSDIVINYIRNIEGVLSTKTLTGFY